MPFSPPDQALPVDKGGLGHFGSRQILGGAGGQIGVKGTVQDAHVRVLATVADELVNAEEKVSSRAHAGGKPCHRLSPSPRPRARPAPSLLAHQQASRSFGHRS